MLKTHLPHKIKRKKKLVISPDSLSARWLSDFRWVWARPADGRWSLMDKALLHLPLDDIMVSGYFRTDCSDPLPRNEEGLPSPHVSFPFFYFLLSYLPLSSLLLSLPNVTFTAIPPPSLSSSHCSPVLVTPLTFCEVLEICLSWKMLSSADCCGKQSVSLHKYILGNYPFFQQRRSILI